MSEVKNRAKQNANALRIMNQFRAKRGMVYELKCETSKLTVSIRPRESAADPADWCVDVRTTATLDAVVITSWAATRGEALGEAGKKWVSMAVANGLPSFDWEAVAQVLTTVQAL